MTKNKTKIGATASIDSIKVSKWITLRAVILGIGTRLILDSVTVASVPSEPTIILDKLNNLRKHGRSRKQVEVNRFSLDLLT